VSMSRARWPPASTPSKYHAQRVVVDGIRFASKREASRYVQLKVLQKVGHIRHLQLQPAFALLAPVIATGEHVTIARYVADFAYEEKSLDTWWRVIEDAKGVRTPIFKLKKKWFESQYGLVIREV
jgi:Protein of unknown function (DUF1064)